MKKIAIATLLLSTGAAQAMSEYYLESIATAQQELLIAATAAFGKADGERFSSAHIATIKNTIDGFLATNLDANCNQVKNWTETETKHLFLGDDAKDYMKQGLKGKAAEMTVVMKKSGWLAFEYCNARQSDVG
ncbi:hypothetical protein F9C28_14035 [Shimwellia pseudoproteus]|uniref:Uncharacterized protein n=1 Tax=Kluyvera cryocrescens TaxID=580 RepID=A0A485ANE4_KLUCR|nr:MULTISPECIES: hypothetical protein [Enterobacteriaceae]MBJ3816020.1 hypothetical protein [Shimwellia pseudoproteus]VFS61383.1 Uncharacterised protein [Kluyvera cryocrescens]